MRSGREILRVFLIILRWVVNRDGPEFLPYLTKSGGTGIKIKFWEFGLSLNARNDIIFRDGMMLSVALGLLNLQLQSGDGSLRHFIAIDLRMDILLDILLENGCENAGGSIMSGAKKCFGAQDIGIFLRKVRFQTNTPLYLTQSTWHENLNSLKDIFPNVYTKENNMPSDEKEHFFRSGKIEFERALDLYICSHNDLFVPAISGMFYANVVG